MPNILRKLILATFFAVAATTASASTLIYIDFGSGLAMMPIPPSKDSLGNFWNNLTETNFLTVGSSKNLVTSTNGASGITVTVDNSFDQSGSTGTTSANTSIAGFNSTNSPNLGSDFVYVQKIGATQFKFTLSGLDSALQYKFTMFASRAGVTDAYNRSSDYTLAGATTQAVSLNASNNTTTVAATGFLSPTASKTIQFTLAKGVDNDEPNGYAYLGGMRIEIIPEPSTWLLLTIGLVVATGFRHRKSA